MFREILGLGDEVIFWNPPDCSARLVRARRPCVSSCSTSLTKINGLEEIRNGAAFWNQDPSGWRWNTGLGVALVVLSPGALVLGAGFGCRCGPGEAVRLLRRTWRVNNGKICLLAWQNTFLSQGRWYRWSCCPVVFWKDAFNPFGKGLKYTCHLVAVTLLRSYWCRRIKIRENMIIGEGCGTGMCVSINKGLCEHWAR